MGVSLNSTKKLWRRCLKILLFVIRVLSVAPVCAIETLNLCILSGENPPVRFDLKCANTVRVLHSTYICDFMYVLSANREPSNYSCPRYIS